MFRLIFEMLQKSSGPLPPTVSLMATRCRPIVRFVCVGWSSARKFFFQVNDRFTDSFECFRSLEASESLEVCAVKAECGGHDLHSHLKAKCLIGLGRRLCTQRAGN